MGITERCSNGMRWCGMQEEEEKVVVVVVVGESVGVWLAC